LPMSVEGCGEPGGSPRSQEEGGFAGGSMVSVQLFAGEREPKDGMKQGLPLLSATVFAR
jgi:hypothetical protein